MSRLLPDCPGLIAALHPLAAPPDGPGWNHHEFDGQLLAAGPLTEAAVLVGLVPRAFGTQVLLTRRTDVLRHHAGQVSFPGGRLEVGDVDARDAAVRETGEEIGLGPELITPLGYLDPLTTISGFRVLPVVASIASDYVAHPDPSEVADVFEVPLAFLMDPANLVRHEVEFRGRPRLVLEFVNRGSPGRRIWGVTASILLNLRERIGRE